MAYEKKSKVVAAVIRRGDRYLCMQRRRSKYPYISERWEFPGGKIEDGESEREALHREIREEMDWEISVGGHIATIDYTYPDFSLTLSAYICEGNETDDFKLLDHIDYKWLTKDELPTLSWTDADAELIKLMNKIQTGH